MLRRIRSIVLSLLLLPTVALAGFGNPNTTVWCIDLDGHQGCSAGKATDCATSILTDNQFRFTLDSVSSDVACCGPCLDVSVTHTAQTASGVRLSPASPPLVTSAPRLLTYLSPVPAQLDIFPRLLQAHLKNNSPLSHLKTVVLLN